MRLIDANGRLLGRVNLIDAAILALIGLAVPMAYLVWALFLPLPPVVYDVTPRTVLEGQETLLRLRADNLRPYLRAFIGTTPARFLLESATQAIVMTPPLPRGIYDLDLFDVAMRVAHVPQAVSVESPAAPQAPAVSEIHAFRLWPPCPKCGGVAHAFEWLPDQELLRVTCKRCRYAWYSQSKDGTDAK